jgi:hypothetical protein
MNMRQKSNTLKGNSFTEGFVKGEIPYYVDNLFYESFGMSCDEVFEVLMKREACFIDIVT